LNIKHVLENIHEIKIAIAFSRRYI